MTYSKLPSNVGFESPFENAVHHSFYMVSSVKFIGLVLNSNAWGKVSVPQLQF